MTREPDKHIEDALEQQKAISEILRVTPGSPGDAQPVLDVVPPTGPLMCAKHAYALIAVGTLLALLRKEVSR